MKKAGESGTSDSREANTAGGAFEETVRKHRLKLVVVSIQDSGKLANCT